MSDPRPDYAIHTRSKGNFACCNFLQESSVYWMLFGARSGSMYSLAANKAACFILPALGSAQNSAGRNHLLDIWLANTQLAVQIMYEGSTSPSDPLPNSGHTTH